MLNNTQEINIATVGIPERKPLSDVKKKYEALRQTAFFVQGKDLINHWLNNGWGDLYSYDQLLDIFAGAQFDKQKAKQKLEKLKQTNFYYGKDDVWKFSNHTTGKETQLGSANQLLGVLIEAQFDRGKARKKLEDLKQYCFYDSGKDLWCFSDDKENIGYRFESDSQLLAVIIEVQFDKEMAKLHLERLKHSKLYDSENNNWYLSDENHNHRSSEQLLGILAEAQFDRQKAREMYEALTKTSAYNPETGQWKQWSASERDDPDPMRPVATQLLAILVEHALGEPETQQEFIPNLPEQRNY